jgi:hypothetical protein
MIDAQWLSDDGFLKIKTIRRLKKLLQREKQGYIRVLHARCGVGLTVEDFDYIVKEMAAEGWCSLKEGKQGGVLVVFSEVFNGVNVGEVQEQPKVEDQ